MKSDINPSLLNRYDSTHASFSYLSPGVESTGLNEFVELTLDISAGIATCLDLISSSDIARDCDETPTLGPSESANLLRLALAANKLLREEALRSIDFLNEHKRIKGSGS